MRAKAVASRSNNLARWIRLYIAGETIIHKKLHDSPVAAPATTAIIPAMKSENGRQHVIETTTTAATITTNAMDVHVIAPLPREVIRFVLSFVKERFSSFHTLNLQLTVVYFTNRKDSHQCDDSSQHTWYGQQQAVQFTHFAVARLLLVYLHNHVPEWLFEHTVNKVTWAADSNGLG